jgi:hypothetical protein
MSDEITIHVTEEDIADGTRMSGRECAVALAGKRELINCDVEVSYSWISVDEGDDGITLYTLPDEARVFVSDFDGGIPVEPFKFTAKKMGTFSEPSSPWPIP